MQNQLFVSGSIEQLSDNLDESKIATTDFSNTNATVSYFPRINFPNITVGYGRNTSSNGLNGTVIDTTGLAEDTSGTKLRENALDSTKLKNAIEDISTRMFIQLGYDLPLGGYRHSLTLNISTAERDDKTLQQLNTRNTSISFTTSTTWQPAFSTSIGLTQNLNKNPYPTGPTTPATLVDYNYTSISLSARYKFMEDKMLVGGMIAPTFGDFQRTLWNANADYLIMKDLTVSTYLSLMQNPGYSSDTIWSLMLKYNM